MARRGRGAIDSTEAAFLELQLHSQDSATRKNALQRLCRLYRMGQRLQTPRHTVLLVLGLLYDHDKKVVRWALNAAAFLVKADKIDAILDAVERNRDDPDILGAGVAALAASTDEDRLRELLEAKGLPLQGATLLAAAQKLPQLGTSLVANRVSIDNASVSELRLASVLVGIEKAPEHMFHADHPNSVVIGELNQHPDAVVAQYSIWAAMENNQLGLAHVRIPLSDVKAQRPNIRAYLYRLLASDPAAARANLDFLDEASTDDDVDARASLARGLRDTYFDGLEELVISWLLEEEDASVRCYLLEHMAAQSAHMSRYTEFVEQEYRAQGTGSLTRSRLELASKGTPLAATLGRIRFRAENAEYLPLGDVGVTNNFIVQGNMTGAYSGTGNASTGDVNAVFQMQAPELASQELEKLIELLTHDKMVDEEAMATAKRALEAPTRTTVQKVLDWFKVAKEGGQLASSTITAAPAILDTLQKVVGLLPG